MDHNYGDFTAVGRISYRLPSVAGDPIDYAYPYIARNQTRLCDPAMRLKDAALFALIGMTLLTVLLAAGFIRDLSALLSGAVAATELLRSGVWLLASLSMAVFLYVFYRAQS